MQLLGTDRKAVRSVAFRYPNLLPELFAILPNVYVDGQILRQEHRQMNQRILFCDMLEEKYSLRVSFRHL